VGYNQAIFKLPMMRYLLAVSCEEMLSGAARFSHETALPDICASGECNLIQNFLGVEVTLRVSLCWHTDTAEEDRPCSIQPYWFAQRGCLC
jgi:hypothetical protein